MKTKTLLTICAILAAIIAVGCSNGSRTTAPTNTIESLNIPNANDANRFEEITASEPQNPGSEHNYLVGQYNSDPSGCKSLHTEKNDYVELQFVYPIPNGLRNGQIIRVRGYFSAIPGGHCNYSSLYNVSEVTILRDIVHEIKFNQRNGD